VTNVTANPWGFRTTEIKHVGGDVRSILDYGVGDEGDDNQGDWKGN